MSIIHCPECNEKISSTVSQCVHCGVKITVCPECEKIYTEHLERCSECGYVFKKIVEAKNKETDEENETLCTSSDIKRKWKIENPISFVLEHLETILSVIGSVFLILAAVKLINWNNKLSDLDNIMRTKETLKTIKTLFGFCITFFIAEKIYEDIRPTLIGDMLSTWANIKKIDLIEIIKTTFSKDYSKAVEEEKDIVSEDLKLTINSVFLNGNYLVKNKRTINHAINAIFVIVGYIIICLFAFQNIDIFIEAQFLQSDLTNTSGWSFSSIEDWWKLIAGIIVLVIGYFYREIVIHRLENAREKWINKNMPEHYENYMEIALNVEY